MSEISPSYLRQYYAARLIQQAWRKFDARIRVELGPPDVYEYENVTFEEAERHQFGCQFPHQCGHRGRWCEIWCPNLEKN